MHYRRILKPFLAPALATVLAWPTWATAQEENTLRGTVTAARGWDVTSLIDGRIESILFSEGQNVRENDLLVQLDDRQSRAALALAESNLRRAKLVKREKSEDLKRKKELIDRNAVSIAALEDAEFAHEIAILEVESAKLKVEIAQGLLEQHRILAKADGLISAPQMHEGSNYSVAMSGPIAQIVQLDPVNVRMKISLDQVITRLKEGNYSLEDARKLEFEIVLADGSVFPQRGKAVAVGYELDPETGEGSVLLEFANPLGLLRPGMPVTMQVIRP